MKSSFCPCRWTCGCERWFPRQGWTEGTSCFCQNSSLELEVPSEFPWLLKLASVGILSAAPVWAYSSTGTQEHFWRTAALLLERQVLKGNSTSPGGEWQWVLLALSGALLILQAESLQVLFQNVFLGKGNLRPCEIFAASAFILH